MAVVQDLIAAAQISRDGDGFSAERSFLVEIPGNVPETKIYDALKTAGVPQFGDPHPILPDVSVTSVTASPSSGGSSNLIRVMVTYSIPEADDEDGESEDDEGIDGSISVSTSLANEQTYFDINGEFLTAQFKGGFIQTVYKNADVQRPVMEMTFRRIESSIPKNAIANFLGRVNSAPWSGFPAKTWLCTKIDVNEEKKGRFDVDYGFSYKEDSWRLEVIAQLTPQQIDELPPNVETANGYAVYDVYKTADFNSLGLSF